MTKQASIGSVSSGTLRQQDLLRAFSDTLESLIGDSPAHDGLLREARRVADAIDQMPDDIGHQADADDYLEDLDNALQEHSPPFCYFGAHEGDGADFGFWPSYDAIRDAIHDDEILEVCDHRNPERRTTPEYIYHINDHGNVTLYKVKLTEVWAIV